MFLGAMCLKQGVMTQLTHHKHQLSHVGPGEVVQQLPHRPHILKTEARTCGFTNDRYNSLPL